MRFLANPNTAARARRVLREQTKVISEYYEQFRRFAGNVHRTIQSLKGTIPTDEFVNLIREVDPSRLGYRISATCQVVQRAKQLVEELDRCRDLPRAVDHLHTMLREICNRKNITINTWLRDHHIDRSQYYVFKKAGGKPVEGEVPVDLADRIKAAILRDAVETQLEIPKDLLEVGTVHDNVHDV
jgi:hypothetical protein